MSSANLSKVKHIVLVSDTSTENHLSESSGHFG